jgi:hypothetical protein
MRGNRNAADTQQGDWDMYRIHYADTALPAEYRRDEPLSAGNYAVAVMPAERALESVLADVGANARLNANGAWESNADAVDRRVLDDVRHGRGEGATHEGNRVHYRDPNEVGGYPRIEPGKPYEDADHDGMADAWERERDLDPGDADDRNGDEDGDGYTNLEEFLSGSDPSRGSRS